MITTIFFIWLAGAVVCLIFLAYLLILDCIKMGISNITLKDVGITIIASFLSWIGCIIAVLVLREVLMIRKENKENG